jgi:hypothetical protein
MVHISLIAAINRNSFFGQHAGHAAPTRYGHCGCISYDRFVVYFVVVLGE